MTRYVTWLALAIVAAGCKPRTPSPSDARLRLGFFANLTHAAALIDMRRGTLQRALAPAQLDAKSFNAGPEAMEALAAGALDAAFVGPSPAVNSFLRSQGTSLVIVSGAATGGAAFLVRQDSGITGPETLHGKRIASPQLGNTQDVSLRVWLAAHDLKTSDRGGDVNVMPIANADILALMSRGQLDGAWVPEPWASRLAFEAGARVLVDERMLWPGGRFPTTVLVVTQALARAHPELVAALVAAHVETVRWAKTHPDEARAMVNDYLFELTHKRLTPEELTAALAHVELDWDPQPRAIEKQAADARKLGYLPKDGSLDGLFDLHYLDTVLAHD